MLPRAFSETVVEWQGHDIEPDVGRALDVVVAAEDVGSSAGLADIAGCQQRDAACADVGCADRVLGLAHAPDQRRRLLRREHLRHALELLSRNAANAFDLVGSPFVDFLARLLEAVDALFDEFLVLPTVLEDVPHHAHQHWNVGAGPDADIFGGVGRGARHSWIDDDEVRFVEFLAFQQVLQRYRMCHGRIAAHDNHGLGVADVVEAVGHRPVAPGIGHAGNRRRMTNARLVVLIVGAPERSQLAEDISYFVGELRRAQPIDRFRAGFLTYLQHLVPNLVDGLIPFDAGPLAIDELHRIFEPPFTMHELAY